MKLQSHNKNFLFNKLENVSFNKQSTRTLKSCRNTYTATISKNLWPPHTEKHLPVFLHVLSNLEKSFKVVTVKPGLLAIITCNKQLAKK